MTDLEYYQSRYPEEWATLSDRPDLFIRQLYNAGSMPYEDALRIADVIITLDMPVEAKAAAIGVEKVAVPTLPVERAKEAVYAAATEVAAGHIQRWLAALWEWIKEHLGPLVEMVIGGIKAALQTAWDVFSGKVYDLSVLIHKSISSLLSASGQVTPESAPALAVQLYGFAYSQGLAAHLAAVGAELIHPLKSLGISQVAAMIGDLSDFGRIAAATIGVYTSIALAGPMRYAVQSETRPVIPDPRTLQTLAVKQDIALAEFRNQMKYHGFSDYWIGRIEASMYREPMYRELLIMAEGDVATDDWMIDKLRRSGYDSADAAVMHKALLKRIALTQRSGYYSQAFSLFKEGYISQAYFEKVLDELEMRPEAKRFAVKSANLAYLYDATKDQVTYWTNSYLKDLITDDQLRLHYSLLGIVPERVWLLSQIARVRKYVKPSQPTKSGLENVTAQVQSKYSQAYIQLYRKGLIDSDMLLVDLVAIGIVPELAEATAFLEEARQVKG